MLLIVMTISMPLFVCIILDEDTDRLPKQSPRCIIIIIKCPTNGTANQLMTSHTSVDKTLRIYGSLHRELLGFPNLVPHVVAEIFGWPLLSYRIGSSSVPLTIPPLLVGPLSSSLSKDPNSLSREQINPFDYVLFSYIV